MKMKTMLLGAALACVYPLLAATVGPDWCVVYPESGSEDVNRVLRIAAEEVRDDIVAAEKLRILQESGDFKDLRGEIEKISKAFAASLSQPEKADYHKLKSEVMTLVNR